jgi:hypothetical protein
MESKAPKLGHDDDQEDTSKMMLEMECSCNFLYVFLKTINSLFWKLFERKDASMCY